MSAIAGILCFENEGLQIDEGMKLMEQLSAYPADDVQIWMQSNLFFGCHAQWVTPESIGEKLPYFDQERRLAITSDAIIDNRNELFESLQIPLHKRSMPDSQIILHAYEKWGEETPLHLIGDFAFMIWDEKQQKLFGARDFSGSRTLYYHHNRLQFSFCTIIQPLLSLTESSQMFNEQWMAQFIAIPGMVDCVQGDLTAYEGIKQVPPSSSICIIDGKVKVKTYQAVSLDKEIRFKTNEQYIEAFQDLFSTAVSSRLRTSNQVGARLSGGLDSGAVASFAAPLLKKQSKQLHTYSYIPVPDFEDWTSRRRVANETPYIQSTVLHVGNINAQYLDFAGKSPYTEIDEMLSILEMPYKFFENSYWIKGIYEAASQQNISVILSGGRGNYSISWGPAYDYYALLMKRLNWIRLAKEIQLYSRNKGISKKNLVSIVAKKALPSLFSEAIAHNSPEPSLIHPDFARRMEVDEVLRQQQMSDSLSVYEARSNQFMQVFHWNKNGMSMTKMSLRYKMWDRDPTNDLRVIRYCLSIPEEQYVQNGMDRALIRRATKNYLPDEVRLNYKKRGLQSADWVHRMLPIWPVVMDEVQRLIKEPYMQNILNIPVLKEAVARMEQPKPNDIWEIEMKMIIRSIIIFRFIEKTFERR